MLTEPHVVVPSLELATRFQGEIGTLRTALNVLVDQNANVATTRDLLLPRLVTGRLDISDVDLSELLPDEDIA